VTQARLRPLVYLAGTVFFWGTSFVAIKIALGSFSPMMVMWLRMIIASIVFLPFWRRVPRPEARPGDWRFLALAVLFIPCLYYLFEGYAVQFTTSSQAGVISAIMPLMVAAGAWLLLGERLGWQSAVGIAVSIVGIAILSSAGVAQESAPMPALGNLLEFGAMLAAAGSTLIVKHLSTRYDGWFLTGLQAAVGLVFFAPLALAHGASGWSSATPQAWIAVLYLGTLCSLGAFGLYNSALKLMPASRAALAINLIPAIALIAGWLLLGESLTPLQVGASVLIVGAVVFAEVSGHVPVEEEFVR
jgi:drug/metabolite transporter (DMT)-like permease